MKFKIKNWIKHIKHLAQCLVGTWWLSLPNCLINKG